LRMGFMLSPGVDGNGLQEAERGFIIH